MRVLYYYYYYYRFNKNSINTNDTGIETLLPWPVKKQVRTRFRKFNRTTVTTGSRA